MRSSWADSAANAEESAPAAAANHGNSRLPRSSYVPPHLRGQAAPAAPAQAGALPSAAAPAAQPSVGQPGVVGGPRWAGIVNGGGGGGGGSVGGSRQGFGVGGRGGGGGGGGGAWNSRPGGWDRRDREPDPFANSEAAEVDFEGENTGINFEAYEDIPVETSGHDVPPPANTFAEIDLGDALNENIRRCKYVKPTPVQRYAIPISIAGRDLMACAQTGSGKTAAFCFPIISGIMRSRPPPRSRGSRTAYPLALILSPTRELSVQVCPTEPCVPLCIICRTIFYYFG